MKKQGFTLAELLITLGIIGVAAALLVPNLGKVLPDRNKITVLNTAKVINEITTNLMNNDGLYYNIDRCVGLACNATPKTAPYNDNKYSGDSKYSRLLISNLNVDGDVNEEANASAFKFKTTDGVFWTVTPTAITGGATIMIDVNGESKGKNCSFDTSSCKKPDQYVFVVDQMGKLHPGDPLTAAYTMNQTKTKNKKNDYTLAANFSDKTKDWQGLTLVVGRDRTDTGCVGDECKEDCVGDKCKDPCKGLSERERFCKKNPEACGDTPGNIDPPDDCAGLTERECYCKKNVGKCEDPCKNNPNLEGCSKPETQPEPKPCEGLTGKNLEFCLCKNKSATATKPKDALNQKLCNCILIPDLSYCPTKLKPSTPKEPTVEPTPKGDHCMDMPGPAGGRTCYRSEDANQWINPDRQGDHGLDNPYIRCVFEGGTPQQCGRAFPNDKAQTSPGDTCFSTYGHPYCYNHGPSGADETPHKVD